MLSFEAIHKDLYMLDNVVLIVAILNGTNLQLDYEYYSDKMSCEAVAKYINDYPTNQSLNPRVVSMCVELNNKEI